MNQDDFIKKMLSLGEELTQASHPMQISIILNDATILYREHMKEINVNQL